MLLHQRVICNAKKNQKKIAVCENHINKKYETL